MQHDGRYRLCDSNSKTKTVSVCVFMQLVTTTCTKCFTYFEFFVMQAKKVILGTQVDTKSGLSPSCSFSRSKTFILGFSKGGAVLNQIVTELGFSDIGSNANSPDVGQLMGRKFAGSEEIYVVPKTKEDLLNSISEIHYVDVGLNSAGAYLTNHDVFERISKRLMQGASELRFILHGTPRRKGQNAASA